MTLSLVFGTAFEVHPNDEILDHPNVRPYRMGGSAYIGDDTDEILHACGHDCAMRILPDEYYRCDDSANYVSGHPYRAGTLTMVRTVDIVDFDPGDDPYVLCAECGAELLRDDEAYEAMFGSPIDDDDDDAAPITCEVHPGRPHATASLACEFLSAENLTQGDDE